MGQVGGVESAPGPGPGLGPTYGPHPTLGPAHSSALSSRPEVPALTMHPAHAGLNNTSFAHPGLQGLKDSSQTGEGYSSASRWLGSGFSMRGVSHRRALASCSPGGTGLCC